jgi:hypothetical protein
VILRRPHVERGVLRVAIRLVRIRSLPGVMCEMRLGKRDQHSDVIRRSQNLFEAQVGSRFTAVIVRVDEVDPETREPLHALTGAVISGPRGANLCVVQRHR